MDSRIRRGCALGSPGLALLGALAGACSGGGEAAGGDGEGKGPSGPTVTECRDSSEQVVPCEVDGKANPDAVETVELPADPGGPGEPEGSAGAEGSATAPEMPDTAIETPDVTADAVPFEPVQAVSAVRKVKQLLVGLAPTDADVTLVAEQGAAGLQQLINGWMTQDGHRPLFRDKMVPFFRNTFQQTGFTPTEDFKLQLLENGGFDFGPLGDSAVGGDVYFRLVQNLQDSFALTAWELVNEGRPFIEVLTTRRFRMTTALKVTYTQIEMPNDEPFNFGFRFGGEEEVERLTWWIDYSGNDIPLAESLDPASPNYLVFDDEPRPDEGGRDIMFGRLGNCRGTTEAPNEECVATETGSYRCPPSGGYAQLFQRLLGYTPRYPFSGNPDCGEHASMPLLDVSDTEDWAWVEIAELGPGAVHIEPFDLPALREATTLGLRLPRVGFFTTPAFLALWNTNDSNQHRVTANQTLLAALNLTFTPDEVLIPANPLGLDAEHSVDGSDCYGCHKTLDPLRNFWASYFDYNDRNDFPTDRFSDDQNPRPDVIGGVLAVMTVNEEGATMEDLGELLSQVVDTTIADDPINRFAVAMTQALCFYANSASCAATDPEFRRVARRFEETDFSFPTLVTELFSSPLVTGIAPTETTGATGGLVSIARRDHLCTALSHRLGVEDACSLRVPRPSGAEQATLDMAEAIVADAFSRGSENPVTPSKPTLFFRAATEMVCEDVAARLIDVEGSVYTSDDVEGAILSMVEHLMGYPPSDPHFDAAVSILGDHHQEVLDNPPSGRGFQGSGQFGTPTAGLGASDETNALRSTFALACQSPTSLAVGL